jgi:hypothetical protein
MTKTELFDFIRAHKLGVLGYLSPQGTPRSALVGIAVTPALEIIFDTVSVLGNMAIFSPTRLRRL